MGASFPIIGMAISLIVSLALLYNRKKLWATDRLRWIICGTIALVGVIAFFFKNERTEFGYPVFSLSLITPIVYNCLDRLFKTISEKIYNRDFYLWLKNSPEIDDRIFAANPHVKTYDKLFSITLLVFIGLTPFVIIVIAK